ncbi:TraB/VirB10 family protein [Celeribacter naphthalenivorans]|uniref:TraB/VirB10 family protein n=1 Tax=Celeribacter naphthalenivorans TaxID=1614694 RepID=UPI001CF98765|nr:TraB/VirB10 family protein [Celeribacter naphthalenivorans]
MSDARKKQQWIIFGGAGAVLLLVVIVLGQAMNNKQAAFRSTSSGTVDETIIADRTSQASPELSWARQSRDELDNLSRTVTELTNTITTMSEQQNSQLQEMRTQYDEVIIQQQAEINALKEGTAAVRPAPEGAVLGGNGENYGQEFVTVNGRTPIAGSNQPGSSATAGAQTTVQPFGAGFAKDFTLAEKPKAEAEEAADISNKVKDLRSYIPAGSYAPAVVISGVDASTGVTSRDDPVPVLVRITGPATTAAAGSGTGRKINITGCTVMGSARGDLSSERVYVRLTTLTCLGKNNQVIETNVAGLIAGSGKAGVRGHVVSREGNLVRNAAMAGALSGFADAVSSAASIASANDEADSVGSVMAGAAGGIIGGGTGNAANTLAEYYIQRAEQYQPVVSLYAGTDVEVVFMEGVALQ